MMLAQRFGSVAYLALAGQEHQHIAAQAACRQFVQRGAHRLRHILRLAFLADLQRTITCLDRIAAPGHFYYQRTEMLRKALCIQRRGVMISLRSGRRGNSCLR